MAVTAILFSVFGIISADVKAGSEAWSIHMTFSNTPLLHVLIFMGIILLTFIISVLTLVLAKKYGISL